METLDEDAFGLSDVVAEISELCKATRTPATVALYGSWGSGKSSLASLLESEFKGTKVTFARFNAFKYGEVPLRRHFLSQLAKSFRIRDKRFTTGLYTSQKETQLRVPARKLLAIGVALGVAVLVLTLLASIAAAVVALVTEGGFRKDFSTALRTAAPGIVFAAPILTAILVLVGKNLEVETTTAAPSSDEQFKSLFRDLVAAVWKKKRCDRIVVFIDELDRCSSDQVVTALETLRTFLEVKPCIFIVAADQQAIERALTESARQSTPHNAANPYYSAGSAYLDKIFQYQLALPPILPRRLSQYALDLIEGRGGVWQRVANRAELVSVLIPTHVRNPRRVKALLNAFALLYRLGLKRVESGTLQADIDGRAAEMAKLVCLRTEFPLFAADLQFDARLPQLVLLLHDDPAADIVAEGFTGVSAETLVRAKGYAREERPVDEIIARAVPEASTATELATVQAPTPPAGAPAEETEEAEEAEDNLTAGAQVEASHARQLIRYLQRTKEIPGPGRDLIYLESSGAAFGLAGEFAEQLERDALDGRADAVATAVASLSPEDQHAAYRLLSHLIFESIGIESQNIARTLFRSLSVASGDLTPVANDVLTALVTYNADYELEPGDLEGALSLALTTESAASHEMRSEVMARPEMIDDDALAATALRNFDLLSDEHSARLSEILGGLLNRGLGEEAFAAVADADAAQVAAAVATAELPDAEGVDGVADFMDAALAAGRTEVASAALEVLVGIDDTAARDRVERVIDDFAPITKASLAESVLRGARPRVEIAQWLNALDPAAVASLDDLEELLAGYVQLLWTRRFAPAEGKEPLTDEVFDQGANAIARLRPPGSKLDGEFAGELLTGATSGVAATPTSTDSLRQKQRSLLRLAELGAFDPVAAGQEILSDLALTLAAAAPASTPSPMSLYAAETAKAGFTVAEPEAIKEFVEVAAEPSPWLEDVYLNVIRIEAAVARRRAGIADDGEALGDALATAIVSDDAVALEAVAAWIVTFKPTPLELLEIVEPQLKTEASLSKAVSNAVVEISSGWTPAEKAELLESVGRDYVTASIDEAVIEAAGLKDASPNRTADLLVKLFEGAGNNPERERVFKLWDLLDLQSEPVQRDLATRVYIPMLGEGKTATRIALNHFRVVRQINAKAPRDRIKAAVRAAATGDKDLAKLAERVLKQAGWVSSKRRWLPF